LTAKIIKPGVVALEKYVSSKLRAKVRRDKIPVPILGQIILLKENYANLGFN
jgi:hypothetical protein